MKCSRNVFLVEISLFFIMIFYTLDGSKVLPDSMKWLLLAGIIFGMSKMALSVRKFRMSKKQIWTYLIFLLVIVSITARFFRGRDTRLVVVLLTMFTVMDQKPEKIVKVMFFAKLLAFIVVILLGGYGHINGAALHGGMIILLFICMRGEKMKKKDFIVLTVMFLCLVVYTRSGSVIIGIGVALLLVVLLWTERGKALCSSKIVMLIFPLALLLNVFLVFGLQEGKVPWVGDNLPEYVNSAFLQMVNWIDNITSHRLTLAAASFQKFGMSVWGGNVDYSQIWPGVYFNLDSGMIWLLQGWGLLITVIFMSLTVMLMRYLIKTKRYSFSVAAVAIALWATQEDMMVSVGTNFLLIFIGQAVQYNITGRNVKDGNSENNPLLLVWR